MLRDVYKQYIKVSRGISDRSVGHYLTGINSINAILVKHNFPITNVFSVKTVEELDAIKAFLNSNEEFIMKDSVGHSMYSVASGHHRPCFVRCRPNGNESAGTAGPQKLYATFLIRQDILRGMRRPLWEQFMPQSDGMALQQSTSQNNRLQDTFASRQYH